MPRVDTSRYYPVRFQNYWPQARDLARFAVKYVTDSGVWSGEFMERIHSEFFLPQMDLITETCPPEEWHIRQSRVMEGVNAMATYLRFCRFGRHLYDLSPALTEAFRNTDVSEARLEGLRLPYPSVYLAFASQPDFVVEGLPLKLEVEGAFVIAETSGTLVVQLCCRDVDEPRQPGMLSSVTFRPEDMQLLVPQAIDRAIDRELEGFGFDKTSEGPLGENLTDAMSQTRGWLLERHRASFHAAASLLVNALFYLTAYPDEDVSIGAETGAPTGLVDRLTNPHRPKDRQRAASALTAEGYAVVRFVGRAFDHETQNDGAPSGAMAAKHWRKGHWRDQRHGPKNTLTKRIWIRPVLVNAALGGGEPAGRIHLAVARSPRRTQ